MPVYKSGAFIQQCFSVHPLCLNIKRLALPEQVILSCTSCNLSHRLTVRSCTVYEPSLPKSGSEKNSGRSPVECLTPCVDGHRAAIGVSTMDVLQEFVGFRCHDCRRTFELDVSLFETHQR